MASITNFLTRRLKLKVNQAKSAVARPWDRKFLGFSFTSHREPKRRLAPKSLKRFKERVRDLTGRNTGKSLRQLIVPLAVYLRGWKAYFGFCQTPSVLKELDSWIRRRLRSVVWKQWRTGGKRYRELVARGVYRDRALQMVRSPHGPWRLSQTPAMLVALPSSLFTQLGLPSLHSPAKV